MRLLFAVLDSCVCKGVPAANTNRQSKPLTDSTHPKSPPGGADGQLLAEAPKLPAMSPALPFLSAAPPLYDALPLPMGQAPAYRNSSAPDMFPGAGWQQMVRDHAVAISSASLDVCRAAYEQQQKQQTLQQLEEDFNRERAALWDGVDRFVSVQPSVAQHQWLVQQQQQYGGLPVQHRMMAQEYNSEVRVAAVP